MTLRPSRTALTSALALLVVAGCTRVHPEPPKREATAVPRSKPAQAEAPNAAAAAPPWAPEWRNVTDATAWRTLLTSRRTVGPEHVYGFDRARPALLRASLSDDTVERLDIPVPHGADTLASCGGSVAFTVGSFLYVRDQNGVMHTTRLLEQVRELTAVSPERFLLSGYGKPFLAEVLPGGEVILERLAAPAYFSALRGRCEPANAEPRLLATGNEKPIAWWSLQNRALTVGRPLPAGEDIEALPKYPFEVTPNGLVAFEEDRLVFIDSDGSLGVRNLPFEIDEAYELRQAGASHGRYLLPARDGTWFESVDGGRTWQSVPLPKLPEGALKQIVCNELGCVASAVALRVGWTGTPVEPLREKPLLPTWPLETKSLEPATELRPDAGSTESPRGVTVWFRPKAHKAKNLRELVRPAQLKLTHRALCDTEFAYCHQSACDSQGELTLALTWTGEGDSSPTLVLGNGSTFTASALDPVQGPRGRAFTIPGRDCGTPSCDGNDVSLVAKGTRSIHVQAAYWTYQESASFCGDEAAVVEDWFFDAATLEPQLALRHDESTKPTYHLDDDRVRIEIAGSNYFYSLSESPTLSTPSPAASSPAAPAQVAPSP